MDDKNKNQWGLALQTSLEGVLSDTRKLSETLQKPVQEMAEMRAVVTRGFQSLIREVLEKQESQRREERKLIAMELVQVHELHRSYRVDLSNYSANDSIFGGLIMSLDKQYDQESVHVIQALRACGVEVRDEGAEYDPRYDTAVKTEKVYVEEQDTKVIRVEAAGYLWADGSGVLRQRHVVVGKFPKRAQLQEEEE